MARLFEILKEDHNMVKSLLDQTIEHKDTSKFLQIRKNTNISNSRRPRQNSSFPNSGKCMPELVKGSKLIVVEDRPHNIAWAHAKEAIMSS